VPSGVSPGSQPILVRANGADSNYLPFTVQ